MLEDEFYFKVTKDIDVDRFKGDFDKVKTIKLDLKHNKLSKPSFIDLFTRLSATKMENCAIDIARYEGLDDEKFYAMLDCIKHWNLKSILLNFNFLKLTDAHFDYIMDALRYMNNMEILHLNFRGVGLNENQCKSFAGVIPKLKKLKECCADFKNNPELNKDCFVVISQALEHIPHREINTD